MLFKYKAISLLQLGRFFKVQCPNKRESKYIMMLLKEMKVRCFNNQINGNSLLFLAFISFSILY